MSAKYREIVDMINEAASSHNKVAEVECGEVRDLEATQGFKYPLIYYFNEYIRETVGANSIVFKMHILACDILKNGNDDMTSRQADMLEVLIDICNLIQNHRYFKEFKLTQDINYFPFYEKYEDDLTGYRAEIYIQVGMSRQPCESAFDLRGFSTIPQTPSPCVIPNAPIVSSPQYLNFNSGTPTVADLDAVGVNLKWYNSLNIHDSLDTDVELNINSIYYSTQTLNTRESYYSIPVTLEETPWIEVAVIATGITGDTSAILNVITGSTGSKYYDIVYDYVAKTVGFVDVSNQSLTGSSINLTIPSGCPIGVYNLAVIPHLQNNSVSGESIYSVISITSDGYFWEFYDNAWDVNVILLGNPGAEFNIGEEVIVQQYNGYVNESYNGETTVVAVDSIPGYDGVTINKLFGEASPANPGVIIRKLTVPSFSLVNNVLTINEFEGFGYFEIDSYSGSPTVAYYNFDSAAESVGFVDSSTEFGDLIQVAIPNSSGEGLFNVDITVKNGLNGIGYESSPISAQILVIGKPIGDAIQYFDFNTNPLVSDLVVTGQNLLYFDDLGEVNPSDLLIVNNSYYITQTINGVQSTALSVYTEQI